MLNAKKIPNNSNFKRQEALESGTYPVRLVQVVGLGLQEQEPFQGKEKPPCYEILLTYEFLDEFVKDDEGNEVKDKPRWLSERMPFHSLEADRAKSTQRYYALDPTGEFNGDWTGLLGTPAMLNVVAKPDKHKEGVIWNNITGLSAMREKDAAKAPPLVNEAVAFDPSEPDMEVWSKLADFIKDRIKKALDYEESGLAALVEALEAEEGSTTKKEEKATQRSSQKLSDPIESEEVDEEDENGEEW